MGVHVSREVDKAERQATFYCVPQVSTPSAFPAPAPLVSFLFFPLLSFAFLFFYWSEIRLKGVLLFSRFCLGVEWLL